MTNERNPNCSDCGGTGYRRRDPIDYGVDGDEIEYERCDCVPDVVPVIPPLTPERLRRMIEKVDALVTDSAPFVPIMTEDMARRLGLADDDNEDDR